MHRYRASSSPQLPMTAVHLVKRPRTIANKRNNVASIDVRSSTVTSSDPNAAIEVRSTTELAATKCCRNRFVLITI